MLKTNLEKISPRKIDLKKVNNYIFVVLDDKMIRVVFFLHILDEKNIISKRTDFFSKISCLVDSPWINIKISGTHKNVVTFFQYL